MVWVFLAEYSLDEFKWMVESGSEPVAGMLFQELCIPLESFNQVMLILADFAQQAMLYALPETPAVIRLFCLEKMLKAGNPVKAMYPQPTVAGPEINLPAVPKMCGSWGYFLVERSGEFSEDRPAISPKIIDLYLYREGK